MSTMKELKVHLKIATDCGYGFDGIIPMEKVAQIMEFSANCITSLPMSLLASRSPSTTESKADTSALNTP